MLRSYSIRTPLKLWPNAIATVATSVELQQKLRERGAQRVKDFHWERTAKAYRAVYRRAAHFPLTEEDRSASGLGLDADSSKKKGGTSIMEQRFIPVAAPVLQGNEKAYVLDCLESTWISSTGKYIDQFEAAFAEFCGVQQALSCSNGTTALHLALLALGIGPGDEVIVPTLTFVATANAVTYCGARPVFVDASPRRGISTPRLIEAKITPRTKGIIVVHLFGHPVDMDAVCAIASRHGLFVLEDAAQAHGAEYKGRRVGSMGDIATFSFFGNKIVSTGEGGMVVTNDQQWPTQCASQEPWHGSTATVLAPHHWL